MKERDATRISTRKISETILDFGEPLLSRFDETPPIDVMRKALMTVISVWNTAMDTRFARLEVVTSIVPSQVPANHWTMISATFADIACQRGEWRSLYPQLMRR